MTRLPAELVALDVDARPVKLVDLAAERPVVLAFLRHFG